MADSAAGSAHAGDYTGLHSTHPISRRKNEASAYDAVIIGPANPATSCIALPAQAGRSCDRREQSAGTCITSAATPTEDDGRSARVAHLARRAKVYG